jgi:hypothetical protein
VFRAVNDSTVERFYWEDAVNYLVLSRPLKIDCSSMFGFDVSMPALKDVMHGAETIAVLIRPYYSRRVFNAAKLP